MSLEPGNSLGRSRIFCRHRRWCIQLRIKLFREVSSNVQLHAGQRLVRFTNRRGSELNIGVTIEVFP